MGSGGVIRGRHAGRCQPLSPERRGQEVGGWTPVPGPGREDDEPAGSHPEFGDVKATQDRQPQDVCSEGQTGRGRGVSYTDLVLDAACSAQ